MSKKNVNLFDEIFLLSVYLTANSDYPEKADVMAGLLEEMAEAGMGRGLSERLINFDPKEGWTLSRAGKAIAARKLNYTQDGTERRLTQLLRQTQNTKIDPTKINFNTLFYGLQGKETNDRFKLVLLTSILQNMTAHLRENALQDVLPKQHEDLVNAYQAFAKVFNESNIEYLDVADNTEEE